MRRGLWFVLFLLCMIAFSSYVSANEDDAGWITIKKLVDNPVTYSIVKEKDSDKYFFVKEERKRGKKTVVYQTEIGELEEKAKGSIFVKNDRVIIQLIGKESISFLRLDEPSGDVKKSFHFSPGKKQKPDKKAAKNERKQKAAAAVEAEAESEESKVEAPSYVGVTKVTPTSMTVKINKVIGATKYRVYRYVDEEKKELLLETTRTTFTIKNLEPNDFFSVYITAVHKEGESEGVFGLVLTPDEIPNTSVSIKADSLTYSWYPMEWADKYIINFEEINSPIYDQVSVVETKYARGDLQPNALHVFILNPVGSTGSFADQAAFVTMTYPLKPAPPKSLKFKQKSSSGGTLSWEKSEFATEYRIYNGTTKIGTVGTNQTSFNVKNLERGKTYYLYVSAANVNGASTRTKIKVSPEVSDVIDMEDPPPNTGDLPAPANFLADPKTLKQHEVSLTWDEVDGAVGYALWINGKEKIELSDVTSYQLTGLTEDTPYELHLRALDEEGRDGYSSIQAFYTLPYPPEKPNVTVARISSVSADLEWEPAERAEQYVITYGDKSKKFEMENVRIKGLEEKVTYEFELVAENRGGKSEPVKITITTIPLSYSYQYAGSLLETVIGSNDMQWEYEYDKNGNVREIKVTPIEEAEQVFDINEEPTEEPNEEENQ